MSKRRVVARRAVSSPTPATPSGRAEDTPPADSDADQVAQGAKATEGNNNGLRISWKWVGASLPIIYACIRLIVAAGGDPETLKGLVLSLDVKALVLGTILPFGSTLLLWVWVFLIAGAINGKMKNKSNAGAMAILAVLLAPVAIASVLLGMPVRYLLFNGILIAVYVIAWLGGESPRPAVRVFFKGLGALWVAVAVGLVVYVLFALGMWLPKERLTLGNETVTGYVLSDTNGWTTYMDENHDLHKVHTPSISNRELVARGNQRSQLSVIDYFVVRR